MINRFKTYLAEQQLISEKPVLIGTSGGRDSMVLCHLYLLSDIPFTIAHCNFNLRAKESDEDETFVRQWAENHQIPIHVKSFDTLEFANENGLSIQMAARDLRLNWFEELCIENNYEFYATAHHQDDAIETYFINQIRGTGLAGLHGILPKQGRLIHPLLFCNREEITQFAQNKQINWRDDSSNQGTKYLRNKVRHQLIPLLKEIKPNITSIIQDNMSRLKSSEDIYQIKIDELKSQICDYDGNKTSINLKILKKIPQKELVLYEIVHPYGFNFTQVSQILKPSETESGSFIDSYSHLLLKNRDSLLLKEKQKQSKEIWRIEEGANSIQNPIFLQINYKNHFKIIPDELLGQFDYQKLKFPLFLRKWREGDFFYPLGMKGKRKLLSDYFIDEKFSLIEKNETWILCSGKDIIWILGKRIDDRFKITKETTQVLEIKWFR